MAILLNIDSAFELDIEGIYEGNSFVLEFERLLDDAFTIPENWANVPYELAISTQESGDPKLMQFTTAENEVTINGNLMTVTCKASQNLMNGKVEKYYYDIVADLGNDLTRLEGRGSMTVKYSVAR